MKLRLTFSSSGFIFDRDASEQVRPCTHLFNNEQNAVRRKEYFVLVTMNPEQLGRQELNTVDSWNKGNLI